MICWICVKGNKVLLLVVLIVGGMLNDCGFVGCEIKVVLVVVDFELVIFDVVEELDLVVVWIWLIWICCLFLLVDGGVICEGLFVYVGCFVVVVGCEFEIVVIVFVGVW